MSQNNRRTCGSKFTGCPKASKIRQFESALDYAHRAIRSLNKDVRKLGIENDVLRSGLQDENRVLTEEQRNAELLLKKQVNKIIRLNAHSAQSSHPTIILLNFFCAILNNTAKNKTGRKSGSSQAILL
ncbi:uncharacterized protein LOC125559760 [Nematostella vectensis]|uniref:uncharacterized protein LOC125559760 n=1 Tax=Nematostella vectensis TaxID=45351 RepID=UPI0020776C98|nr:uncharacterized protein LOC125559760 [Nematostella vectensis]